MIVAGRLFVVLGVFGLIAGAIYYAVNDNPELAGVGLLGTFFASCMFLGLLLLRFSMAKPYRDLPDTGLHGSAHPERGAADEHGHIHLMDNSIAPFVYSFASVLLLAGFAYRDRLGPWGMILGGVTIVVGTAIWYRNVSKDTRAALATAEGGAVGDHGGATSSATVAGTGTAVAEPVGPPGPGNWFEQLRQALEAGDADWAAEAYSVDAVYNEPANPPHQGREAIRAYLNDFLKGHREVKWKALRMGTDERVAIVEWTLSFRTRNDGYVTDQPGMTVIEANANGIVYHRDYL